MGKNKGIKERDMFVLKRFPKVSLVELRNEENGQNYPQKGGRTDVCRNQNQNVSREVSERSRLGTKE